MITSRQTQQEQRRTRKSAKEYTGEIIPNRTRDGFTVFKSEKTLTECLVFEEMLHSTEGYIYKTYGITLIAPNGSVTARDVSVDFEFASNLARKFCKSGLSQEHFLDAIYDAL